MDTEKMKVINRNLNNSQVDEEDIPLPGFRFHPTDEELVAFYLRCKVDKKPLNIDLIRQIDIYKYDPWDLPRMFFFSCFSIVYMFTNIFYLRIIYMFITSYIYIHIDIYKKSFRCEIQMINYIQLMTI